jgi:hypothetical protein
LETTISSQTLLVISQKERQLALLFTPREKELNDKFKAMTSEHISPFYENKEHI